MDDKQLAQLNARLDAMRLAVETLFAEVPSGMTARGKFMKRLEEYAQAAPEDGPDSSARLYELEQWKRRIV